MRWRETMISWIRQGSYADAARLYLMPKYRDHCNKAMNIVQVRPFLSTNPGTSWLRRKSAEGARTVRDHRPYGVQQNKPFPRITVTIVVAVHHDRCQLLTKGRVAIYSMSASDPEASSHIYTTCSERKTRRAVNWRRNYVFYRYSENKSSE